MPLLTTLIMFALVATVVSLGWVLVPWPMVDNMMTGTTPSSWRTGASSRD